MSGFNADQVRELENFVNGVAADGLVRANGYADARVAKAIEEERHRLANIFETSQPVTKVGALDLGATLRKPGYAIRSGLHE